MKRLIDTEALITLGRNSISYANIIKLITRAGGPIARRGAPFTVLFLAGALLLIASSFFVFSPGSSATASAEDIQTFAGDCITPKNDWDLGGTACATVTDAAYDRRIVWIAPDGSVAQVSDSFTGTGTDSYTIPQTGEHAQVGTWFVLSMDPSGAGFAVARFVVRNPQVPNADLSVSVFGPTQVSPGGEATYKLEITNRGPDAAENVTVSHPTPADTTFDSSNCTNLSGATCSVGSIDPEQTIVVTYSYIVSGGAAQGSFITNTATVATSTNDPFSNNNTTSSEVAVVLGAQPSPCTINCPSHITVNNDPNSADPCVAVVTYATPTTSGDCSDSETGETSPVLCNPPSGSAFPVGTTEVTCSTGGFTCSFPVTVNDTRTPVPVTISCPSNIVIEEESEGAGSVTVNFSTTATGNCVNVVCEPASGTRFEIGTTTVNCIATDSANATATCSFTVTVNESGGGNCAITCPGDVTVTAAANQCNAVVTFSAPTTSGTCDPVTCRDQNNVVRQSGDTFPVGTTAITCTSGLASCVFNVTVIAPAAPTITTCAANKSVPTDVNCEGVIPNLLGEVTTTGCNVVLSQSPAPGSIVPAGIYIVTITAENTAGEATCNVTVKVDNTPPVITCPANVVVNLPLNSTATSMVVNYPAATATDNCGTATVTTSPPSGSTFPVGATTVTATATDEVGNTSTCTFTVTVLYNFTGFFSPVDNPPVLNTVNAGRAIPVKFSLSGNKGLNIFAAGHPASGTISCDANAPPNEIEETLTAGSSSLSYDANTDTYIYVWKTENSWAGTCRQLVVKLNDGSIHVANFKFR